MLYTLSKYNWSGASSLFNSFLYFPETLYMSTLHLYHSFSFSIKFSTPLPKSQSLFNCSSYIHMRKCVYIYTYTYICHCTHTHIYTHICTPVYITYWVHLALLICYVSNPDHFELDNLCGNLCLKTIDP